MLPRQLHIASLTLEFTDRIALEIHQPGRPVVTGLGIEAVAVMQLVYGHILSGPGTLIGPDVVRRGKSFDQAAVDTGLIGKIGITISLFGDAPQAYIVIVRSNRTPDGSVHPGAAVLISPDQLPAGGWLH